jgi:acetoin utilization deacetylase AcuC-like enzyme
MALTEDGYAALCAVVRDVADRHAAGRLALILEGGYNLDALARSVHGCVEVLAGAAAHELGSDIPPGAQAREIAQMIRTHHGDRWSL